MTNPSLHVGAVESAELFAADLALEGEPEREFHAGVAARIPRKTVAAGALFRDEAGRILMVEPRYKPTLEIPGGIVEPNESPRLGCMREVTEELGFTSQLNRLLVVDWVPGHGVWGDGIQYIFDGGVLEQEQIASLVTADDELAGFSFLTLEQVRQRVRPSMARRLASALDAVQHKTTLYLEFGRPID